jgi:endonuclease/exonuclease/phosphatase (EEP) superfamily protein YafD
MLPLAETDAWWVRVFDFPRPQVAALLALCAAVSAFALDRHHVTTWAVLGALLLSLVLQLHRIWPYTPLHPPQAEAVAGCAEGARLSVLTVNLRASNEGAARFLRVVRETDPDVVFVVEVDHRWAEALAALEDRYPERRVHPRDDAWGLALYSRLPLVDPQLLHLLSGYVPSVRTGLRLPSGGVVTFHGLHPKPPLPGKGTGERDAELLLAGRTVRREGGASVVAGDLNDVAWSDTSRLFQRIGGLLDPRIGRGLFATWNANLPAPLRWPIDHVFFTSNCGCWTSGGCPMSARTTSP